MSHLKKIANYAGLMILLTVLLKPIGIVKDMLVASKFGVSADLGIYFLLFGISSFFTSLMYSMHRSSITPAYIKVKLSNDKSLAYSLAIVSGLVYALVVGGLCSILYVFIEPLIHFFAPGFSDQRVQEASKLVLPLMVLLASMAANDFFTSLLEAEQRFVSTRLAQACIPISLVSIILLYYKYGWIILLYGLALGYLISSTAQALLYLFIIKSTKLSFKRGIVKLKEVLPLWLPMAAGSLVSNSTTIINRMMISMLGAHELAIYGYSDTLVTNINSILMLSINTAVLPVFSAISADNKPELGETAFKTYRYAIAMLLPVVLIASSYGDIIIQLIYQHGNFSQVDTTDVFNVFSYMVIAIIPLIGIIIMARVYNVLLDAQTPFYASIILAALNISFNYVLMQSYGVAGIALATVLVHLVVLLFFMLILSMKHHIRLHARDFIGYITMIATGYFVWYISTWGRQYGLPTSMLLFCLSFLASIYVFKLREYQHGFDLILQKSKAFSPYLNKNA